MLTLFIILQSDILRKAGHGSDLVTTGGTTLEALTAVHGSHTSSNLCELKCGQKARTKNRYTSL